MPEWHKKDTLEIFYSTNKRRGLRHLFVMPCTKSVSDYFGTPSAKIFGLSVCGLLLDWHNLFSIDHSSNAQVHHLSSFCHILPSRTVVALCLISINSKVFEPVLRYSLSGNCDSADFEDSWAQRSCYLWYASQISSRQCKMQRLNLHSRHTENNLITLLKFMKNNP